MPEELLAQLDRALAVAMAPPLGVLTKQPAPPMEVATTVGVLAAAAPARMLAARAANALSLPEILEKALGAFSSSSAEATGRHDQKWLLL